MKVLVAVKRVVDYNVKVRVKSDNSGVDIAKNDCPELTAAKTIVSGGRALGSAQKFAEVMTAAGG